MTHRRGLLLSTCLASVLLGACDDSAHHACEVLVQRHAPRVRELVDDDLGRAMTGVSQAADLVAPGFGVEDPARREHELRWAIQHRIREPPRGIPELMISPISFVAAVDLEGHVVCRDIEPDPMRGLDVGALFPHVHAALTEGVASYRLVEFQPGAPTPPPEGATDVDAGPAPSASVTVVYAAPARVNGQIVGAIIAGTPLWSTARRLTRQIQAEGETTAGAIFWVYLYRGDELFHSGTPSTLDEIVPNGAARAAGFEHSPGGFCGEENQFGRWYCYGVIHLPQLGDDVGAVIYRSDPVQ
jgi:hypothetical protein